VFRNTSASTHGRGEGNTRAHAAAPQRTLRCHECIPFFDDGVQLAEAQRR
jgi:hypothetical protein